MNDNQVIIALIESMRSGLNRYGLSEVKIKQNYQPRAIGLDTEPTVYLHKIMANRWGWIGRKDTFSTVINDPYYPDFGFGNFNFTHGNFATPEDQFQHHDLFYRAATFQIDGLSTQNPINTEQLTASDIVEITADALQSIETINELSKKDIRIERITQIRENYFTDDRDRHEQIPSFDFIVTYLVNRTSIIPVVDHYNPQVIGI